MAEAQAQPAAPVRDAAWHPYPRHARAMVLAEALGKVQEPGE